MLSPPLPLPLLRDAVSFIALVVCLRAVWKLIVEPLRWRGLYRKHGVRGLPFRPVVGNARELRAGRSMPYGELGQAFRRRFGTNYFLFLGPTFRLQVADPDVVYDILVKHAVCWHKSPQSKRGFRDLLGSGLLTSDAPLHDVQRRRIAPAFHFAKLKEMVPSMAAAATRAVDAWMSSSEGAVLDINRELSRLTLSIISSCAFAADTSVGKNAEKAATLFADLAEVQQAFTDNLLSPKLLGRCSPSHRSKRRRILANVERVKGLVRDFIAQRRLQLQREGGTHNDLLALLLTNAADMGDEQLLSECMTFVLAGHETTSQLLTWATYLLAKHPTWAKRARDEVARVLSGRSTVTFDDLHSLPTVRAVLLETLRLMPPAVSVSRQCVKRHIAGGLPMPPGVVVSVSIWGLHHSGALWENPDTFDPSRFADGIASAVKHRMAFLPFGVGPRSCIGRNFALTEARIILATMLRRMSWTLDDSYRHMPIVNVTLKPKYGMPVRLHRVTN